MPDPKEQGMFWFKAVATDPQHWLGVFRKAFNIQSRSMHSGPTVVNLDGSSHVEHVCTLCNKTFPTKVQHASHNVKKHDYINPLRLRIYGTSCLCCSVEFHTKFRLFKHLSHSRNRNKCAAFYTDTVSPMEVSEYKSIQRSFTQDLKDNLLRPPAIKISLVE